MSRAQVVAAAIAEVGADTHDKRVKIWESALGREVTYHEIEKLAWCGGFALFCLHSAGLGKDVFWHIGSGFLLQQPHPLPVVKVPEPGDIGYQNHPFQHHFIVESVDGALVHSVDGNQPDVRRKVRSLGPNLVFYSIRPLLDAAGASHDLPEGSSGPKLPCHPSPAETQHAINSLIMTKLADSPPGLLLVDGVIGPKSITALKWAQRELGLPVTGNPDAATCAALGI